MNTKKKPRLMEQASRNRALILISKRLKHIADRTEPGENERALDRARAVIVSVIQQKWH